MDPRGTEPGNDLVLDNRKLIIGFLLLIAVCGAFFVIGFMEGKRQGVPTQAQLPPSAAAGTTAGGAAAGDGKVTGTTPEASNKPDASVKDQLEWYKNVQGSDSSARKPAGVNESPKTTTTVVESKSPVPVSPKNDKAATGGETKNAAATLPNSDKSADAASRKAIVPPIKGAKVTYSVQVGAFTQRHEADVKAEALKAKGFTCVIEEPKPPDPYYRVKVGNFEARAEAVAMQRKLRKAGFDSIVKSN
jgi:cell division protein FtsN